MLSNLTNNFYKFYSMLSRTIFIKKKEGLHKIKVADISYIHAEDKFTKVYCNKGNFLVQLPLKNWWTYLTKDEYIQVNRSTIVSTKLIETIYPKDNLIKLENNTTINIGRTFKTKLLTFFTAIK